MPTIDRATTVAVIQGDIVTLPGQEAQIAEIFSGHRGDDMAALENPADSAAIGAQPLWFIHNHRVTRNGARPVDRLGGTGYRELALSSELAGRFEELIFHSAEPWTPLTRGIFDVTRSWGYDLWVVGGAVRDLLLGAKPRDVKDLDLAGTTPQQRLHLFFSSLIDLDPGTAHRKWKTNSSSQGIVHVKAPGGASVIQHSGLRSRWDAASKSWRFGADLVADYAYRDIAFNTLFYDATTRTVTAPHRDGLEDLGLDPEALATWTEERGLEARANLTVRPIPLAPNDQVPSEWSVKGLARVVKSIDRNPSAQMSHVGPWLLDAADPILERVRDAQGYVKLQSFLQSFSLKSEPTELFDRCSRLGFPDWALTALEAGLGLTGGVWLGAADRVLTGYGLRHLVGDTEPFVLGDEVLGLDDLSPATVNSLLLPVIGDVEPVALRVNLGDKVISARCVVGRSGRYVELNRFGLPMHIDEADEQ